MSRTRPVSRDNSVPLTVVAPRGYPWRFNGPRNSRHALRIRGYAPFSRLKQAFDGVTAFSPLDTLGADLIHAFNRIPLNRLPYVLGFESHLPRAFGLEGGSYEQFLLRQLLGDRCRRIVAISQYAANNFRAHVERLARDPAEPRALEEKLEVRYPNLPVGDDWGEEMGADGELVVTFVGNHFARKGGCSTVRMAELCLERRLPVRFNIVSTLQYGGVVWTDPTDPGFYEPYLKLLELPNVSRHANLPNAAVQDLLRQSHFAVLTTFSDTFGFSALEAMALGTPVIATRQAALPEFITDGVSGVLLEAARTPGRQGWIWDFSDRGSPVFEKLFATEIERLAVEAVERIAKVLAAPAGYREMRRAAQHATRSMFDAVAAQDYWDGLYSEAVAYRAERPGGAGERRAS